VDDGVGGWIKKGVDAHANFMRNAMTAISPQQKPINGGVEVEPRKVLDNAFLHTKAKGSSMASIMTLKEFGYLHAINVGDSGFMIFKNK
jgi:protein phosphatase PTC7